MKITKFVNPHPIIYISGPISMHSYEKAVENFTQAHRQIGTILAMQQSLKYGEEFFIQSGVIVNPFLCHPINLPVITWEEYMLEDIKYLFRCNTIFMLRDWEKSRGTRIEKAIAEEMGFQIIYE